MASPFWMNKKTSRTLKSVLGNYGIQRASSGIQAPNQCLSDIKSGAIVPLSTLSLSWKRLKPKWESFRQKIYICLTRAVLDTGLLTLFWVSLLWYSQQLAPSAQALSAAQSWPLQSQQLCDWRGHTLCQDTFLPWSLCREGFTQENGNARTLQTKIFGAGARCLGSLLDFPSGKGTLICQVVGSCLLAHASHGIYWMSLWFWVTLWIWPLGHKAPSLWDRAPKHPVNKRKSLDLVLG